MATFLKQNILFGSILLTVFAFCTRDGERQHVGNAPEDAYLEGSDYPYYGSEDAWDRRFFTEHIKDFYKRRGQRQMLDIVEGKPGEAAKYCRELLAADPEDLESLFNLAVAQTQMNDIDSAFETMKQAVAKGLPFSRFLAGPRDLLEPLTTSAQFQEYAARRPVQLIHGPMIGCLTDKSAKFWVRSVSEVPVQIVASTSTEMRKKLKSSIVQTKASDDFTAILSLQDLKPDAIYYYDVLLDGQSALKPDYPNFRTYASQGEPARFTIGFGGGAGYVPPNERIWDVIRSFNPAAFLFLGDNVYVNMPEALNGVHYYTYYRRQSRPEFRRLVAATCIYAIWDDHDCATDDVWMGPYRDKPSWKMPLFHFFKQNWNNPGYGDPEWPGAWFSFSIADVDFFMLDGRFYRTNPYDKNPTMLGPVQKSWLFEQIKKSSATFKVLVSPVPWSFGTKGGAVDTWNGFQDERNEIFNFLAENKIDGVFLLSADRHRSDAWKIERDNGYPLFEFESSRLTNQHVHEVQPDAMFGYNEKQSFGLLTFDTSLSDPAVTYQIVSIDNEIVYTFSIKKSEISHVQY